MVNAQTDSPFWAESYDRKLIDIFGVESEIAKRIAESLQAKLTGREEQALAVKPTNNPEAYDLYLRGLSFEARSTSAWKAVGFYEQAVRLDPSFALAWARLSRADADLYSDQRDATPGRRDATKRALENAQKLQPNSPETLLALGYYQYRVLRDDEAAKTRSSASAKCYPVAPTCHMPSPKLPDTRDTGMKVSATTSKPSPWTHVMWSYFGRAAWTYAMVRQFPAALRLYDRALDITPNDPELMAAKARIYQGQGNLQEAAKFLQK